MPDEFWERPDVVEQFASRAPDHRLANLIEEFDRPESIRVLDLGCAGGRNTVALAERGFDVHAVDASAAMVERTRERLRPIVGDREARDRVRQGPMTDLSHLADDSFDLVLALGIYHNARAPAEWDLAVSETARVLKEGGRLLVNHFTPGVDFTGDGVRPVPGVPDLYDGFPGGQVILLDSERLDSAMSRYGFRPVVPSVTVRAETETRVRVSVNALYRVERE